MTFSMNNTTLSHRKTGILCSETRNSQRRDTDAFLSKRLPFETSREEQKNNELSEDVLNIKDLPSNFVSVSKPSAAIERLMAKKQKAHETAIEEMVKELGEAHENCENEFRERSNRLKKEIDLLHKKIGEAQNSIENLNLVKLTDNQLQSLWNSEMFIKEEKKLIDDFHEGLRDIEANRKERVKRVMQKYYEIFHNIFYTLPFETQVFLEKEIQEYNKSVLSNFAVYEDLHLYLHNKADHWRQELENWLSGIKKRKHESICFEEFRQLLDKKKNLESVDNIFFYDSEAKSALNILDEKLSFIAETFESCSLRIDIFDESSVNGYCKKLQEGLADVEDSGFKLVDSYKTALTKVADKYRKDVEDFIAYYTNPVTKEDKELLDAAVTSLQECYLSVAVKLEEIWNKALNTVQNSIDEICKVLNNFNAVWAKEMSRLLELQDATVKMVDDLNSKSQKTVEQLEKKVNTYSQQLREALNEENINKILPQIHATLDLISEKYNSMYEEELKTIKNYVETIFTEVKKFIEQLEIFLSTYGQEFLEDNLSANKFEFIKQQLVFCQTLASAIMNWKETLLKNIMLFRDDLPMTIKIAAEAWETSMVSQRSSTLQNKLNGIVQSRKDIVSRVVNPRIEEIKLHASRLQEHETEVSQVLKNTFKSLEEFLNEEKKFLEDYERINFQTSEKISEMQSTAALTRLQNEMKNHRDSSKNILEQKKELFKKELQTNLQSLLNKNDEFLKDIKTFVDGGTYHPEEAKTFRKSLTTASKLISKSKTVNAQKLDKSVKDLNQSIEKSYKTILDRCTPKMRELKFHEDSEKIMIKCTVTLERQAFRLLEDDTSFVNSVVDYIENSTKVSSVKSEAIARQYLQFLNSLDSKLDNLMIPFPTVKENSPRVEARKSRKSSISNKRIRQKSVPKTINYRDLLSGSEIPVGNAFSVTVMETLLKTLNEIQGLAMIFFSPSGKRNETETGYQEHMQKMFIQLRCYREQLESLWREEVQDLMKAAATLELSIIECILATLNKFHEQHTKEMILIKETRMKTLNGMLKEFSKRRDEMSDSLKVTQGRPKRRDSLKKLTEEGLQEEDNMQTSVINEFDQFKNELKELLTSYETSLLEEAEPLRMVVNKLEERGKRRRLQELFNNRKDSGSISTQVPVKLDIADKTNRRSIQTLSSTTEHLDTESIYQHFLSVLHGLVENAKKIYNSVEETEHEIDDFIKLGNEFKEIWKTNVGTLLEIYEIDL